MIGNPPYVRRTSISGSLKQIYERQYISAHKQYDLYLLFIEKGLGLLNNKGVLVYINPIRFFNSDYGEKCRELIVNKYVLHEVIDVSQISVFENAMTYPCILTIGYNTKSDKEHVAIYRKMESINDFNRNKALETIQIKQETIQQDKFFRIIFSEEKNTKIVQKINLSSRQIGDFFNVARGIPNNKVDFLNGTLNAIKSTNVRKYSIVGNTLKVNIDQPERFSKRMIVLPRTVFFLQATIKDESVVVLDRIYYLSEKTSINKHFALGIINSKVINFWFEYYYATTKVSGNYFDLNGNQIKSIPIPNSTPSQQQPIITLVNQILKAKQSNPHADTSECEKEIDQLVYQLYGLTDKEIVVVEGKE